MKALVIHPSALVRGVARRVLEGLGAGHIVEAKTAAEGINQACQDPPNVVVAGWGTEQSDGPSVARSLRARGLGAAIVLVGNRSLQPLAGEGLKAGADACLFAPLSPDLLSQRIDEAVAARTSPRPAPVGGGSLAHRNPSNPRVVRCGTMSPSRRGGRSPQPDRIPSRSREP